MQTLKIAGPSTNCEKIKLAHPCPGLDPGEEQHAFGNETRIGCEICRARCLFTSRGSLWNRESDAAGDFQEPSGIVETGQLHQVPPDFEPAACSPSRLWEWKLGWCFRSCTRSRSLRRCVVKVSNSEWFREVSWVGLYGLVAALLRLHEGWCVTPECLGGCPRWSQSENTKEKAWGVDWSALPRPLSCMWTVPVCISIPIVCRFVIKSQTEAD